MTLRHSIPADWKARYLETSKLPTMYFQSSLPRLPIPSLQDSVTRYLQAQKQILSEADYQVTEELAKEFSKEGSEGWQLQQQLIETDKKNLHTSYNRQFWHDRYMYDRSPSVVSLCPFVSVKLDSRAPSQAERATNFIHSAVLFHNSLNDQLLQPDLYYTTNSRLSPRSLEYLVRFAPQRYSSQLAMLAGAYPFDMSQYNNLFATTRVPKREKDEVVKFSNSRHVVVMRNHHMYSVQVLQENGLPVDRADLYAALVAIINDTSPPSSHPINYLTGGNRDYWADAQQELMSDPHNVQTLHEIQSSLFVVCLDSKLPETESERMESFLHNHGANRWFDKSFTIIVSADADVAIQPNHSCGDGWLLVNLSNKLYNTSIHQPSLVQSKGSSARAVYKHLSFNLSDNLKSAVERAKREVEGVCQSLSLEPIQYRRYGRDFLKSKSLSPQGTMQIAFMMAYYRLHGSFGSTINPCNTLCFRHGRTEWIRPVTRAAKECAEAFEPSSGVSEIQKSILLRKAVQLSSQLFVEASKGAGFDRHLHAIKSLAEQQSKTLKFFQDPSYAAYNSIQLLLVSLAGESLSNGALGPVSSDGISTGAFIWNDHIQMYGASYVKTRLNDFIPCLISVLDDIHNTMSLL